MAFRAYTVNEVRAAAQAYGLDPDFVESIYAVESSRGTNPKAMTTRSVKRKRDTTFVRGPFQLEDDTTADLLRENKLSSVDVNDPDVHLDLALRQMQKLQKKYNGDPVKMAQAYLGRGTDELGTTSEGYGNKIIQEMQKLKGEAAPAPDLLAAANSVDPFVGDASPADDMFGIPAMDAPTPTALPQYASNNIERDPLGLPMYIAASTKRAPPADSSGTDLHNYVQSLVDDELQGKDFINA